jgi:hypothetical protein
MCAFGVMHGRFLREFVASRCKRERRWQRMLAFRSHWDSDYLNVENSDRKVQNVATDSTVVRFRPLADSLEAVEVQNLVTQVPCGSLEAEAEDWLPNREWAQVDSSIDYQSPGIKRYERSRYASYCSPNSSSSIRSSGPSRNKIMKIGRAHV